MGRCEDFVCTQEITAVRGPFLAAECREATRDGPTDAATIIHVIKTSGKTIGQT